ncbi:glycoside hydrolase family 3 C-terminal domain-containing protein [Ferrimonas pelagia]|uniref:Glycoside hydrolase family 3 C-terminal domain-containing protein n=1 Tax=Ferrimonas pelagia TaxID=1177826 RepID=A0ABP9FBX6_9GAMM
MTARRWNHIGKAISLCIFSPMALAAMSGEAIARYPIPFYDHSLSIEERLDDISARLSPAEKGQMISMNSRGVPRLGLKSLEPGVAQHGLSTPRSNATTVFPTSIAWAATWEPRLIRQAGDAVSDEIRAQYHNGPMQRSGHRGPLLMYSPTINMARDPRWGRTQEAYGEDPVLAGEIVTAYVQGLQGEHPTYLKSATGPKHFVANNEEHNRFHGDAVISEKQLREYYFPAYKQAVEEGNAKIVMTAYNALNGEPAVTNTWLVRDVLRGEWGFDGFVIGDYGSVRMLTHGWQERGFSGHGIYPDDVASTAAVMNADTLDYDNTRLFRSELMTAIEQEQVAQDKLDRAFRNVMRVALQLGIYDPETLSPWKDLPFETLTSFKPLALELAEKSMVLLQNEPVEEALLLPLDKSKLKSVAVIGPNADVLNYGTYSGTATEPVTALQGIRDYLGEDVEVLYVPWSQNTQTLSSIPMDNIIQLDEQGLGIWQASYHDNRFAIGEPVAESTVVDIDFHWRRNTPDPVLDSLRYSVTYRTTIVPPQSGTYTLGVDNLGADVSLLVNGGPVLRDHGSRTELRSSRTEVYLDATKSYEISLVAMRRDNTREHTLRFGWQLPQHADQYEGSEVAAAKQADAVIALMGLSVHYERESIDRSFEGLPAEQTEMLQGVLKANPNTVVVLQSGSSIESPWLKDNAPAILQSWYPGEQGGNAIARTLFGDNNPGGKLPLTYVRSWDDLPPFGDYDLSKGRTYMYLDKTPLWAFGHGLSYTQFDFDNLKLGKSIVSADGTIELSVRVSNSGDLDGDEVVQVYVADRFERSERPKQRLKAFERISLAAGASKTLRFAIDVQDLAYWDEEAEGWALGDRYEIRVGNASDKILLTDTLEID